MSDPSLQRQIRRHVHAATWTVFASCQPAFVRLLASEITDLGLEARLEDSGVSCTCSFSDIYRLELGCRIADRLLLRLAERRVGAPEAFHEFARSIPWRWWIPPGSDVRFSVDAGASRFAHEGQAQQIMSRAIGEALGARTDRGPGAAPASSVPGPRVLVRIYQNRAQISLDLDGEPRYLRGGKEDTGTAAMRETSAAALLRFAGIRPGIPVVDGMSGSGTFALEAARIRSGRAARDRTGFLVHSPAHRPGFRRAAERLVLDRCQLGRIIGLEQDVDAVERTLRNLESAGLAHRVTVAHRDLRDFVLPPGALLVTNPGWGGRLPGPDPELLRSLARSVASVGGSWLLIHPDQSMLRAVLGNAARILGFHSGGKPVSAGFLGAAQQE